MQDFYPKILPELLTIYHIVFAGMISVANGLVWRWQHILPYCRTAVGRICRLRHTAILLVTAKIQIFVEEPKDGCILPCCCMAIRRWRHILPYCLTAVQWGGICCLHHTAVLPVINRINPKFVNSGSKRWLLILELPQKP